MKPKTAYKFADNKSLTMNQLMFVVTHSVTYAKSIMIGMSCLFGSVAGLILQSQNIINPAWYENPVVAAAIVTGIFLVITQCLAWLKENRAKKVDKEEKDDERHQSTSDKMLELALQEREVLLNKWKVPYEQQIKFLENQKMLSEIGTYEARFRSHRLTNEINRLNLHIHLCHQTMSHSQLEIPDFETKYGEDLMVGLAEELEKFKRTLERQSEPGEVRNV